ncbi:MAG TPA: hypothetical protein VG755_11775 [Nannocystaceae bacterium]|nr:hypothetical protein [Nannocystaceae bacterium]
MRRIYIASTFVLSACGVEKISGNEGGGACVPEAVQAAFDRQCANMPACHGASATPQVPLDLRAGASDNIIGQTASQMASLPLVEIGNIDGSYLALKMEAMPPTGARMPQNADFNDPAVQADIALILGWIGGAEFTGCAGGSGSDSATDSGGSSGTTGEPPIMLCGLDDLDPGATNPIVSGDAAMQIPTDIGVILHDNCGCHYSPGPLAGGAVPYPATGPFQISTWDEWQGNVTDTLTIIDDTLNRVDKGGENLMMFPGIIMPQPTYCHTGDGESMPLADRETLVAWLMAGAPDGATWTPP